MLDNLDPVSIQADHFARVVGQQTNGMQAEIAQDLCANAAFVLQPALAVGRRLIRMVAESRTVLMQIHQHPGALFGDALQ